MKLTKLCLWAIAVTVVLTIGTYFLPWFLPLGQIEEWIFVGVGILILVYFCVALGCAVALEKGRLPRLMRSGIAIGAVALVGWISMIFFEMYDLPLDWYVVLYWPTSWACLIMVIGLLLLPEPRAKWWMQLRRITIALFILLALIICLAVTFHPRNNAWSTGTFNEVSWQQNRAYEEAAAKYGWVIGLLSCGGALFVWLAAAFIKPTQDAASNIERTSYWLSCPRCGLQQQAMTGSDTCKQCNLQIRVQLT